MALITQPPLPSFDVRLTAPDIGPWIAGNTGVPGFTTRVAHADGPHIALLAISHGNEIAGAIVLERLLREGLRPAASLTQISGEPVPVRTIATRRPSGLYRALMLVPL